MAGTLSALTTRLRRFLRLPACLTLLLPALLPSAAHAQAGPASKAMPVTFWDFNGTHADFEGANCWGGKGQVMDVLGPDRKPALNPNFQCKALKIHDWFRQSPDNARYCRDLVLTRKPGSETLFEKLTPDFFPLDDAPTNENIYRGGGNWQLHNFHFCMEMHATFMYRGGEVLHFAGDDDVWVFINNRLALDLGGIHPEQRDSIILDVQKEKLGIVPGRYYNFDFFFCERQTSGSNLKLTTSIDIVPPPTPGYHIADANVEVIGAGDTLVLARTQGPKTFHAVEISVKVESVDCTDVTSQVKTPAQGSWILDQAALPSGASAVIDPAAHPLGLHRLVFDKAGKRDTVWIRLTGDPPVLPVATRGYYQDRNGDGRIETAIMLFRDDIPSPPAHLAFRDPFDLGRIASPRQVNLISPRTLEAALPDFRPGTGFDPGPWGEVLGEPGRFAAGQVIMEDSVGPVLRQATSFPALPGPIPPAVEVEFSEPVAWPLGSRSFPLDTRRGPGWLDRAGIRVDSARALSPTRLRFHFAADSKFPLPGDSVRILPAGGLADTRGNLGNMGFHIPVGGSLPNPPTILGLRLEKGLNPVNALPGVTGPLPLVLHGDAVCINCVDPRLAAALGGTDAAGIASRGPTWAVTTLTPFRYEFACYDILGQVVNRAEGELSQAGLDRLRGAGKPGDSVTVRLTFLPFSRDGQTLGTGAFVAKVTVSAKGAPGAVGSQGESLPNIPQVRSMVSRFGFIRAP